MSVTSCATGTGVAAGADAVLGLELVAWVVREGAATVVVLAGDADVHTAPEMEQALGVALASSGPVVVDLEDVQFIDRAAACHLAAAAEILHDEGRSLRLRSVPPAIRRALARFELPQLAERPDR